MASRFNTFRINEDHLAKVRERRRVLELADALPTEQKIPVGISKTTKSEGRIFPVLKYFYL